MKQSEGRSSLGESVSVSNSGITDSGRVIGDGVVRSGSSSFVFRAGGSALGNVDKVEDSKPENGCFVFGKECEKRGPGSINGVAFEFGAGIMNCNAKKETSDGFSFVFKTNTDDCKRVSSFSGPNVVLDVDSELKTCQGFAKAGSDSVPFVFRATSDDGRKTSGVLGSGSVFGDGRTRPLSRSNSFSSGIKDSGQVVGDGIVRSGSSSFVFRADGSALGHVDKVEDFKPENGCFVFGANGGDLGKECEKRGPGHINGIAFEFGAGIMNCNAKKETSDGVSFVFKATTDDCKRDSSFSGPNVVLDVDSGFNFNIMKETCQGFAKTGSDSVPFVFRATPDDGRKTSGSVFGDGRSRPLSGSNKEWKPVFEDSVRTNEESEAEPREAKDTADKFKTCGSRTGKADGIFVFCSDGNKNSSGNGVVGSNLPNAENLGSMTSNFGEKVAKSGNGVVGSWSTGKFKVAACNFSFGATGVVNHDVSDLPQEMQKLNIYGSEDVYGADDGTTIVFGRNEKVSASSVESSNAPSCCSCKGHANSARENNDFESQSRDNSHNMDSAPTKVLATEPFIYKAEHLSYAEGQPSQHQVKAEIPLSGAAPLDLSRKVKKWRRRLKQPSVHEQLQEQNHLKEKSGAQDLVNSPGFLPMDFSPYKNTPGDKQFSEPFIIAPSADVKVRVSDSSTSQSKMESDFDPSEQLNTESVSSAIEVQGMCETWRQRGNRVFNNGDMAKAEEFYTRGIDSVPSCMTSGQCIKPLVICYSNRAATRMSCGNLRGALKDCAKAAALDPNFLKVQIRAAYCHLVLGEVEDALDCYNKCLESSAVLCLDRRITIEAADGIQRVQKLAASIRHTEKLLEQSTQDAALNGLNLIAEALSTSPKSEKLLEMKAEFMFKLRKYEEVIQLCEQTVGSAVKNFASVGTDEQFMDVADSQNECYLFARLWRLRMMAKSYFYDGKLEKSLNVLESLQSGPPNLLNKDSSSILESLASLAATIRDLLNHKNAGNVAVQSGRYTDAIEHYTSALSSNLESLPFAAICFCNRAAAYQALGQITDAIADCSLAMALDKNYIKAVSRRAMLHETIRNYGQAASDLQRLVSFIGNSSDKKDSLSGTPDFPPSMGKELRQARRRLCSVEKEAKKGTSLDFYVILGVKQSDSVSDVKKAYRKAALRHHPDKACQYLARSESGDEGQLWKEILQEVHVDADRLFKMIGEAYTILSDPAKRQQYDLDEEIRKASKHKVENSHWKRTTDDYNSPSDRSSHRRNWQDSWKTYGQSRSRW